MAVSSINKTITSMTAEDIVNKLDLRAHPEGGYYRETYRTKVANAGDVAQSTAIYYLVTKDADLIWHRIIGKDEIWHFYMGDPIEVRLANPDGIYVETVICGQDIFKNQLPQMLIPASYWQSARCLGEWSLFGCTVSPGFEFSDFYRAEPHWKPLGYDEKHSD